MSALASDIARLQDAHEVLAAKWAAVREQWRDANAEHIEEQYLEPLSLLIRGTVPAMGQLSDELEKAIRKCSDEGND